MNRVAIWTLYTSILAIALIGAAGCNSTSTSNCNRAGCDAITHSRSDYTIARGIGGFIAYESDAIGNGCQECGFSSVNLQIWSTDTPVSDVATAQSVVSGSSATFTFVANDSYEKELDPGYYLVCSFLPGDCASVAITAVGVFTVNVKSQYGPSRLLVFEPGTGIQRTDGIFSNVSPPPP